MSGPRSLPLLLCLTFTATAAERDAFSIEAAILTRHMPYGTILNPIFTAPGSTAIAGYTRCGDSAIWTGHYLAAEAFRYAVTRSNNALANVRTAVAGLTMLTDVTGTNLLARCALPAASPYAAGIESEEAANGIHQTTRNGQPWVWIGNTSRDQYCGVFFGLGAAYDLIAAPDIRTAITSLATRLTQNLSGNAWNIVMPDGSISTTFLIRPDEELAMLQVAQHMNPTAFASQYSQAAGLMAITVPLPLGVDAANNQSSYFKFNLDFISLYNLIRLQSPTSSAMKYYEEGFAAVRTATATHQNAHFDIIDHALHGPNAARDADAVAALQAWLQRPRTDIFVDWRNKIPACAANEACNPLPIAERPPSDFLWQLDPYQLSGGGQGIIETAGIDYILPYWMGRYYGVIPPDRPKAHIR